MRPRTAAAIVTGALVAALVLPMASATAAAPATDGLVISEYVEGPGFDKALEIYNGTGAPVDLTGVEYRDFHNGSGSVLHTLALTGTLADGDVHVIAHSSANADILAVADQRFGGIDFTGNDTIALADTSDGSTIDSFGQSTDDSSIAGNVTLRRTGFTRDTDVTDPFALDAYTSHATGDVSHLGTAPGGDPGDDPGGDPGPEPEPETCTTPDDDLTLISRVQGRNADPDASSDSPLHGERVTIRAVVTLADDDLGGYFVQEEPDDGGDGDDDGDPATSEGLFVFDRRDLPSEGDTVELTDEVTAFGGLTQLSFPDTEVCDTEPVQIAPTRLVLPLDRHGREALEGMLVTHAQDLQVSGLFPAYRFGELGLALDGPLVQPTSAFAPDDPGATDLLEHNAESYLVVNDRDEAFSQFSPYPWELLDDDLSAGDTFPAERIVGVLNSSFGEFRVEPLDHGITGDAIRFPGSDDTAPRQPAPALPDGNDVVAFNVLNYFNTFGDSAVLRGARSQAQFDDQTAKIVDAITAMDAAVYGLIELENDYEDHYDGDPSSVPSIQTLVDALNDATAPGTYDWVVPDRDVLTDTGLGGGGLGTDAIAQGFVYQPARAEPMGPATTFDIDALLTGDADNSRWPLAQTFRIDGEFVTVVVNHLKSKGSSCSDTGGPRFAIGDDVETTLTGNCNLTRSYAAERLVEWVQHGATPFPTDDVLLLGDFNSYEEEDPIEVLVDAGFTDLVQELGDDAFTFKFDGRYGRLDYAFASPSLAPKVTDTAVWQVNSREPVGHLYYNDPVDLSAYASSDHDPVVVSLTDDQDPRPTGTGRGRGSRR